MSGKPLMADAVVHWQSLHGRHALPWQNTRDPYRVWLSEIMLQQTQVATVLGYYERFLVRFPDVMVLGDASLDEVLALWSGLGYYGRARNLHRAAQQIVNDCGGEFPRTAAQLAELPGVGRSTASAIAAFCFDEQVPILDANVRRVLTRYLGFAQDLARPANERALWELAARLVPERSYEMPAYTQGMMDLGSTVCSPKRPSCLLCPLSDRCVARAEDDAELYPVRTRAVKRTQESWWLLWLSDAEHRVWLERRPIPGIWAGLQCLPIFADEALLAAHLIKIGAQRTDTLPVIRHTLTHRELVLHTVRAEAYTDAPSTIAEGGWMSLQQLDRLGLPAPVRMLLEAQPL